MLAEAVAFGWRIVYHAVRGCDVGQRRKNGADRPRERLGILAGILRRGVQAERGKQRVACVIAVLFYEQAVNRGKIEHLCKRIHSKPLRLPV